MSSGTIVVLPTDAAELAAFSERHGEGEMAVRPLTVPEGPPETTSVRICGVLAADPPEPPLIIVAFGESARHLPAVALAQRSAHRWVREYVLVDPALPPVSDAWPDAPVRVFADSEQQQARLRGWDVLPRSALDDWVPREP